MQKSGLITVILVALLMLVGPVMGQEATETISPPTDNGGVVVETPGFSLAEFVAGIVAGATGALIGVFGIVGRLKNDMAALNAIEWLGKSIPVDALDRLNELGKSMRDAGEVLDKVTDGKPNTPPVAQKALEGYGETLGVMKAVEDVRGNPGAG